MQFLTFCLLAVVIGFVFGKDLTTEQRVLLLKEHNRLRSLQARGEAVIKGGDLAPPSNNMYKMSWNDKLQSQAQTWTDSCTWGHSSASSRPGAGENMYQMTDTRANATVAVKQAVQNWFDELKEVGGGITSSNVTFTREAMAAGIGHWSQVVWATTTELGCGVTECGTGTFYVCCQYLPAGNYVGKAVYSIGKPCSAGACSDIPDAKCDTKSNLCVLSKAT